MLYAFHPCLFQLGMLKVKDQMSQFFQAANKAGVRVILDAGGMDPPIPLELLNFLDILSPNESELARLTRMPTESFYHIAQAVAKCHEMVSS